MSFSPYFHHRARRRDSFVGLCTNTLASGEVRSADRKLRTPLRSRAASVRRRSRRSSHAVERPFTTEAVRSEPTREPRGGVECVEHDAATGGRCQRGGDKGLRALLIGGNDGTNLIEQSAG